MANLRRKLWARAENNPSPEQPQEQAEGEGGISSAVERLSAYSAKASEPAAADDSAETPVERVVAGEEANRAEAEVSADDLAFVGEEVGTVLESARGAAGRIRRTAQEEAERLHAEAESAAAAQVDEARRLAEADRADGNRIRSEAEAYAKDARAAADAFAEKRRSEAEREAAQIVGEAQRRLAGAQAEVEQRVRQGTEKARQRSQTLQAEVKRYEKRLESILVVFRGMSSQLENLLQGRQAESATPAEVSEEAIEDALRPDRSSSRVA